MNVAMAELQARLAAMSVDEFAEWYMDFVTKQINSGHSAGEEYGRQYILRQLGSPR